MSSDSTRKPGSRKAADRPKKPYPDFPLTPHASGAWQKKIRGKIHYFGRWANRVNGKLVRIEGDGWKEALELYKAQADDLLAGRRDALAKQYGPVRLGNEIQKVRTIFKYGFEAGLIDKPIRYGPQFKKPSASVMRRHRAKNGERMLEADEVRRLLKKAGPQV